MFLLSKSFLLLTIAVVLGVTGTTEPPEPPENVVSMPKRRRIVKAECRKCLEKDIDPGNHHCTDLDPQANDQPGPSNISEDQSSNYKQPTSGNKNKMVECDLCYTPMRSDNLKNHRNGKFCKVRCSICCKQIRSAEITTHLASHEMDLGTDISTGSSSEERTSDSEEIVEEGLSDLYTLFQRHIDDYTKNGRMMDIFNYRLPVFSTDEIAHYFKNVFRKQKCAFKVSVSVGYVLYNNVTKETAYYASSQNNQLLIKGKLIRNSNDKMKLLDDITSMDLRKVVERPNSQWVFVKATNVTFFVYKIKGCPIGSPVIIPKKLLDNKSIHCLAHSLKTGKPYNDRKCFFRCAALYLGANVKHLENAANKLVKEYCEKGSVQNFNGVTLDELEDVSRLLNIPINVYEQSEGYTELLFSTTLRTTSDNSDKVLNLLLHEDHFMFIKDLDKFSSSYRCHKCDKLFTHSGNFNRHLKTCSVGIKKRYVGGNFRLKPTIFEIFEGYGVTIPKRLRQFQYRAVFDIECLLRKTDRTSTAKTEYTSEHELLSVSVCSNVPGFQKPRCFVIDEADGQRKVVKEMLEYLNIISDTAAALTREEMKEFIPAIEAIDDEKVKERFNNWLTQLPVLSYNGGRYDLQVIRKELIPLLTLADSVKYVIKKGSTYMCIVTEQLKFLDVMFYVAPGKSYAQFLMAYGAELKKSFFPYVYMDSFEKLKVDTFPEYNAFFSNLKNKNTLEPSVDAETTLEDAQKAGLKNYMELKALFEGNKWTMKEFLIFYNNLDTEPFIEALENLTSYYFDRGVDVFKDAISAPGIAERVAFMSLGEGSSFSLFGGKHNDLVQLFLDNNVGGPALIFDRKAVVGETRIRHDKNGKLCKKVLGLDANALYLGCMAEEMPCGMFVRRRAENSFKKEYPTPVSAECIEWLAWLEASQGITIQHAKNGLEFQAGKKRRAVDGYCESLKTIYQYQGCLYHGCEDCFTKDRDTPRGTWPSHNDKREKTRKTTTYLESEGYKVVEMWGCEWRKLRKTVTLSNKYNLPHEERFRMTEGQILKAVSQGEIFGAIEVDIHVPENLKHLYSEMTPVFKNVTVTRDDIGEHMDAYLTDTKQNFPDTRYLIGSMFGTKVLLTTPLAKWYMDHGLVITKVYQLIQFKPIKCFEKFADMVSNDRRAGDMDKNNAIKAETSKLLGNSVYGHTIMRKDLHNSVRFVTLDKASKLLNDPRFTGLTEFDQETFEVTSQKKSITYDLPLQIGFWTYQLAKLKMLSFFYDVIDKYISRDDYCILEMDTDSLYLALSGTTLDELVKPHLKVEWEREKVNWFPRTDTPENTAFDKRKPGLFKVEFDGVGFIGLNAKTYFCWSEQGKSKYSSKGVSHSHPLSAKDYIDVLEKTPINPQTNRGFVRSGEKIFTYSMKKDGLKYLYAKRKVLANGMSTTYLDI